MRVASELNIVIIFLFALSFLGFIVSFGRSARGQNEQTKYNEVEPFHIYYKFIPEYRLYQQCRWNDGQIVLLPDEWPIRPTNGLYHERTPNRIIAIRRIWID